MLNVHYGCWMWIMDVGWYGCKHPPFDADAMAFHNKKQRDKYEL